MFPQSDSTQIMFGPGGGFGRRGAFATEGSSTRGKWGSGIGYGSSVSGDIYNGAGSQVKTERGAKTTSETKRFGSFAKQTSSPAPMASTSVSGSGGGGAAGDEVERGTHLDEARIKVGIVESMCPEDERRRRVDGNDLHILEQRHPNLFMTDPGANAPRQMTEDDLVIKRHMRAAAGTDISQPELLRTPQWLSRTVDHLIANCLDKGPQGGGDLDDAWDDPRIQLYMTSKKGQLPHMMEDETSSAVSAVSFLLCIHQTPRTLLTCTSILEQDNPHFLYIILYKFKTELLLLLLPPRAFVSIAHSFITSFGTGFE